ncbi:MAG: hypothetical protein V2I26_15915 [Halieaceae bacterium]|jgi:hypothetical protein|nr:hypothetical protein [Halieaceae bacterium]
MKLLNIESLIECDGQITVGHMRPVGCVAIANDESNTLAMLKQRPGESLMALLERLDQAIERAVEDEEFADEINSN